MDEQADQPDPTLDLLVAMQESFVAVVEALNGQRAQLMNQGWTQEQAQDVIAAIYRMGQPTPPTT